MAQSWQCRGAAGQAVGTRGQCRGTAWAGPRHAAAQPWQCRGHAGAAPRRCRACRGHAAAVPRRCPGRPWARRSGAVARPGLASGAHPSHRSNTSWGWFGPELGRSWALRGRSLGTALPRVGHCLGTAWAIPGRVLRQGLGASLLRVGHSLGMLWAQPEQGLAWACHSLKSNTCCWGCCTPWTRAGEGTGSSLRRGGLEGRWGMRGRDESERRGAESQWIVAARPLCHLQYPVAYLSRLQRILPAARSEKRFKASPQGSSALGASPTARASGGPGPLLLVGKRAAGARVASSPDSDLEAFSHNPTHGSFAPLAFQPSAMTNCANQRFLSY